MVREHPECNTVPIVIKVNVTHAECRNSQFIIPTLILSYLDLHCGSTKLILKMVFYLMSPCTIKDVFILLITICTNIFLHPYFFDGFLFYQKFLFMQYWLALNMIFFVVVFYLSGSGFTFKFKIRILRLCCSSEQL